MYRLVILIIICFFVTSCGIKGELDLPPEETESQVHN